MLEGGEGEEGVMERTVCSLLSLRYEVRRFEKGEVFFFVFLFIFTLFFVSAQFFFRHFYVQLSRMQKFMNRSYRCEPNGYASGGDDERVGRNI